MNLFEITSFLVAQTTGPAATQTAAAPMPWWRSPMIPFLLVIVLMWVFVFRSKKNQDRQRQDMLGQMKRGDRVQTIGGILGKVVEVEDAKVLVKVDESSNTKIWFSRSAIHRVITEEKAETK